MKSCHSCQAVIDEYLLDKQLEPLRDLTVDDFNVCADCATIVADACVKCGSAVYVPEANPSPPITAQRVAPTSSTAPATIPAGIAT